MLNNIEEAIEDIRQGKIIIVLDDENREAEGDLICAAQGVTPETINFMAKHGRGLICTALTAERIESLHLPMMVGQNNSKYDTPFTVSVEAKEGTTTGISAQDRSVTSSLLADSNASSKDFITPGHTFPLKARDGGVLVRAGHTEAAVDLARLAGLEPAGVLCEIMNDDGTMARYDDLVKVSAELNLKMITIEDLISYRSEKESLVELIAKPSMPTKHGLFEAYSFREKLTGIEHLAMVKGEISLQSPVNVRVHSECLTGDAFGSLRCDCGEQLSYALEYINENNGIVLYLRAQEGRGIGLANKMRAYELQNEGFDTVEANVELGFKADDRSYGIGAQILRNLGVTKMNLMTNNPGKIAGLKGHGLEISSVINVEIEANSSNHKYLSTKKEKMGHALNQNFNQE